MELVALGQIVLAKVEMAATDLSEYLATGSLMTILRHANGHRYGSCGRPLQSLRERLLENLRVKRRTRDGRGVREDLVAARFTESRADWI